MFNVRRATLTSQQDKASLEAELLVLRKSLETKETERTDHYNQITVLKTQVEKLTSSHADAQRTASRAQQVEAEADLLEEVSDLNVQAGRRAISCISSADLHRD